MSGSLLPRLVAAILTLSAALAPAPAAPQARTLHWRQLDVEARLDAAGDLHVVERQVMVFSGDWNGGERVFRLEPGQQLRLGRLVRLEGGQERPLSPGSLDTVDRHAWSGQGRRTLRWRSRAPSDPPFRATELTYLLEYTLSGALVADGAGGWTLAHDFAFPDRPGPIQEVTARLTLDPSWDAAGAPLTLARRDLPPSQGAVLTVPLRWVGPGAPPSAPPAPRRAASRPASQPAPDLTAPTPDAFPPPVLAPLLIIMATVLGGGVLLVWRHDRALGRLGAAEPPRIDQAWLERNVKCHQPELVGAAWDDTVGSPEAAAVLARMTLEKKLEQWTERGWLGLVKVVHLRLLVPRTQLEGYERRLIDGLFVAGDTIDSTRLRRHYRKKGFDPATRISKPLKQQVAALAPPGPARPRWPFMVSLALAVAALAAGLASVARGEELARLVVPLLPGLILGLAAIALADHRSAIAGPAAATSLFTLLVMAAWAGAIAWLGQLGATPAAALLCHLLAWSSMATFVAGRARTRLSREGLALRLRLTAARGYLEDELRRPRPRLGDDWIPYLLALGLGRGLDRWIRVYGAATTGAFAAASHGPGGGGPVAWSGGGGGFSGGGASGSWVALGAMAAGVPSPGSSGSSSGSSGGSSSGGGGGGGW